MKIKSIKKVGKREVYDIEVEGSHSYTLSNGVYSHNSGLMYSANTIILVTKATEKKDGEVVGNTFNMSTMKSRYVREKARIPISVSFSGGVDKYSGLLEVALAGGFVVKPAQGWYSKVNFATGEVDSKKYRQKELGKEFWTPILEDKKFKDFVENTFAIANRNLLDDSSLSDGKSKAIEEFTDKSE